MSSPTSDHRAICIKLIELRCIKMHQLLIDATGFEREILIVL